MSPDNRDVRDLLERRSQQAQAFNARDAELMADMSWPDVLCMPPAVEASIGRAPYFRDWVDGATVVADPVTRVEVDGDLAYTAGSYVLTIESEEGAVEHYGRSLEVWRRDATGTWRIIADMWNVLPPETGRLRNDVM